MTDLHQDDLLAARFASVSRPFDDLDWADVTARARHLVPNRKRKPFRRTVLVALAVLAVLVVTPAFGLPQKIVSLFSSGEPAPPRTERLFSTLDQGAPRGLETGIIPGTARKALDVALPEGARATLWVAPTSKGGFCQMLQLRARDGRSRGGSGPGCDDRPNATGYGLTIPGPITPSGIQRGPVVVSGHTKMDVTVTAVILFEDGERAEIPVTWISDPIDAGFFVYGLPPTRWKPGRFPTELRYVDAEGNIVGQPHPVSLVHLVPPPPAG